MWRIHCERPGEVAIALWFHDAIHDPMESGNEVKSASWAAQALMAAGVGSDVSQRVDDLVMATRHDKGAEGADAQLLVDIDLAILSSPQARFDRYDRDVRKEYESVPVFRYRVQRAHVLKGFMNRTQIFNSAPAQDMLESQAQSTWLPPSRDWSENLHQRASLLVRPSIPSPHSPPTRVCELPRFFREIIRVRRTSPARAIACFY